MSDKLKIRIMLILSFCAFLVMFVQKLQEKEIPEVTAIQISSMDVQCVLGCSGVVTSDEYENIVTDMPVIAKKINVKEGDRVKKGEVLAEINVGSTEKMIGMTLSSFVALNTNEINYDDLGSLLEEYGVEYDTEELFSFDINDLTDTKIPQTITASIDGIVTEVNIEENLASTYGEAVFCISGSEKLTVVSDINESSIERVSKGLPVLITGSGFSKRSYTGTVAEISGNAKKKSSLGSQSAFVEVTVDIDNSDEYIKPGYNAKLKILTDSKQGAIVAPYNAVRQNDEGDEYVYIYENGRAYRRIIETGEELEEGFEVLEGLFEGDVIITEPDKITSNGCSVSIAS